jgi:predicted nuclease with TOPRIM domain
MAFRIRVKEVAEKLSEEERETHKDLIKECEEREKKLDECWITLQEYEKVMFEFTGNYNEFFKTLELIQRAAKTESILHSPIGWIKGGLA